jgi:hypothetical protein
MASGIIAMGRNTAKKRGTMSLSNLVERLIIDADAKDRAKAARRMAAVSKPVQAVHSA